jgi:ribosomal protein L6P/L9E
VGVGYRVQAKGKDVAFQLGYSHPVEVKAPEGISFRVNSETQLVVLGCDKAMVGQVAKLLIQYYLLGLLFVCIASIIQAMVLVYPTCNL